MKLGEKERYLHPLPQFNQQKVIMIQREIEFFWPLTQQIPLELDYSVCEKPRFSLPINAINGTNLFINGGITSTTLTTRNLTVDVDTTTFKVNEKPNIIRRGLFNILGIKWVKK